MTADDVIRMAREAGLPLRRLDDDYCNSVGLEIGTICRINDVGFSELERFAALVAAAEREECAKVCKDEMIDEEQCNDDVAYNAGCFDCAAAIRARGTK